MMSVLRKVLVTALFVLLSAVLFTAFLHPVARALVAAIYGRYEDFPRVGFEELFMALWLSITAGLSLSVTAAIFLLVGVTIKRLKPVMRN